MEREGGRHFHDSDGSVPVSFRIAGDDAGLRLDHFLVLQFPSLSRSRLTGAIKKGDVLLNGAGAKASRKLQQGDVVSGCVKEVEELSVTPQKVPFDILFEDAYLLIISKPPQLVVHPACGNPDNTLVNGLVHHCRSIGDVGDPVRPGIVHRLDKDTSGVMVVAKNNEVLRLLVEMFKDRRVKKTYLAIVLGVPREQSGRVVAPIGRHPIQRKKMAIREDCGKFAATSWRVMATYQGKYTLMEVGIETGRTHQIRVHLAAIGHPVAGDTVYGPGRADPLFPRQMLHSAELRFPHPLSGHSMIINAAPWPDMVAVLRQLELEHAGDSQ